jgi:hypothetical protein
MLVLAALECDDMRGKAFRVALILLLGVYLFAPVFESVDHWDHFPQSGNDIVLTVLVIVICLGVALSSIRDILEANCNALERVVLDFSAWLRSRLRLPTDLPAPKLARTPLRI